MFASLSIVASLTLATACGPAASPTSSQNGPRDSQASGQPLVNAADAKSGVGAVPSGVSPKNTERPLVMATTYPMEYFAQRIAGGLVRVESPLPEGEDPIFWIPPREVVERFQQADVIVINGADFERWVASAALPLSRVCDASHGFASEFVTFQTTKHRHGSGGMHSHEGIDGHTWMDPNNAVRQAERIEEALTRRWPEHAKQFRDNASALKADLMTLDATLRELSPRVARVSLIASHPAYNYIARRYGWTISNIDLPPDLGEGDVLSSTQAAALDGAMKAASEARGVGGRSEGGVSDRAARPVFVLFEATPSDISVRAMQKAAAAAGVLAMPVVFSPAEARPAASDVAGGVGQTRDFVTVMRGNLGALDETLRAVGAASPSSATTEAATPATGGGG